LRIGQPHGKKSALAGSWDETITSQVGLSVHLCTEQLT
jgi:hypothetical protein